MIRPRLYLFNTNTGRWHQLQNYLLWNDLRKRNQNVVYTVESGNFTGIKLSNVGDSYLWNITSDICRMGLVWTWLLTTNKVCSSHNVLSVRVFFIQSRRIDHKHGKMLSDHRDAGLEQIWPRTTDENLPTSLLIFCYLVKKSPWIIS